MVFKFKDIHLNDVELRPTRDLFRPCWYLSKNGLADCPAVIRGWNAEENEVTIWKVVNGIVVERTVRPQSLSLPARTQVKFKPWRNVKDIK